jgi:hypothetical protein
VTTSLLFFTINCRLEVCPMLSSASHRDERDGGEYVLAFPAQVRAALPAAVSPPQ